jgi:hypothetical protein
MNLDRVTYWREMIGRAGAFFCIIFLVAAVDGIVSNFRQPDNLIRLLPGESIEVNGSLKEKAETVQDLDCVSDSNQIQLTFEALHSGFWFGGYMWRGLLKVSPTIAPGEYSVKVARKGGDPPKFSSNFRVEVYPDHESYRRSSKSLMRKYLDVSPWWVLGVFVLSTFFAFALVYFLSQKREFLLALDGKAEVYLIEEGESECIVSFGLGTNHGVRPGTVLTVSDRRGSAVGTAEVRESSETDSTAVVTSDYKIKPGFILSIRRLGTGTN